MNRSFPRIKRIRRVSRAGSAQNRSSGQKPAHPARGAATPGRISGGYRKSRAPHAGSACGISYCPKPRRPGQFPARKTRSNALPARDGVFQCDVKKCIVLQCFVHERTRKKIPARVAGRLQILRIPVFYKGFLQKGCLFPPGALRAPGQNVKNSQGL